MRQPASDTHGHTDAQPRPHAAGPPFASTAVPAWALLPLRLFLGVTFIDAGLGKLLSPAYFGAGPRSFATLAEGFAKGSPLAGPVRAVVLAHPFLFALLLAVLELVVGVCTVIGLASRLAAGVGMGLSLTFFLTASWRVRPFFYGADLPFAAGWLTLLLAGHGGLPSVDATLLRRRRSERGLGPADVVGVPFDRLQQQCAQADQHGRCASATGDPCAGVGCPLAGARPAPAARDASRRAFLAAAGKAAGMLVATLNALQTANTGYDMRQVLAIDVPPSATGVGGAATLDFFQEATRRIGELPVRHLGQVEDVAYCAVFLAAEGAHYLTGQVLQPNGGWVMA